MLTGEVYFEVSKDIKLPFRVKSKQQMVEVLGTHFDVSACEDNAVTKTTLLGGAINVTSKRNHISKRLTPGFQSSLENDKISLNKVDVETEVSLEGWLL